MARRLFFTFPCVEGRVEGWGAGHHHQLPLTRSLCIHLTSVCIKMPAKNTAVAVPAESRHAPGAPPAAPPAAAASDAALPIGRVRTASCRVSEG